MKKETIIVGICAFLLGILAAVTVPRYFGGNEREIVNMGTPGDSQAVPAPELNQAIENIETLLKGDPENVNLHLQLGNAYFDTRKFDKAINEYEFVLEKNPNNANVLTDLGICYREIGDYDRAIQEFEKAAASDPAHVNSRFNAGIVYYYDIKNYAKAKEAWESYLKVAPNDQRANDARRLIEDIDKALGR